jgi:hypothetical protein
MLLARNVPPGSRRVKDEPEPEVLTLTLATYGSEAGSGACPDAAPTKESMAAPAASQRTRLRMPATTGCMANRFTAGVATNEGRPAP